MNCNDTLVIDIDGTLLDCEYIEGRYQNPIPRVYEIDKLKELRRKGWYVILWTGRHWHHHEDTVRQLNGFGIPYDELMMGKPLGIYIDADCKKSLDEIG